MRQHKELHITWHHLETMGDEPTAIAAKAVKQAKADLKTAEKALISAFSGSVQGKSIKAVMGYGDIARVDAFGLCIGGGDEASMSGPAGIKWVYEYSEPARIDPKTLNALLSSKLLSDEEKRDLLMRQGILPQDEGGEL